MIAAGLISAAGLLFLAFKLGPRRIIAYDIAVDIIITLTLMYALKGSYAGMMAALLGGLIVSIILFIMRKTMVREELAVKKAESFPYRKLQWEYKLPNE